MMGEVNGTYGYLANTARLPGDFGWPNTVGMMPANLLPKSIPPDSLCYAEMTATAIVVISSALGHSDHCVALLRDDSGVLIG